MLGADDIARRGGEVVPVRATGAAEAMAFDLVGGGGAAELEAVGKIGAGQRHRVRLRGHPTLLRSCFGDGEHRARGGAAQGARDRRARPSVDTIGPIGQRLFQKSSGPPDAAGHKLRLIGRASQ
jgi:hypothetical protein